MPVKKSKSKKENEEKGKKQRGKRKTTSTKKKVSRKEREDIKKAVKTLPSLLIEQVTTEKIDPPTEIPASRVPTQSAPFPQVITNHVSFSSPKNSFKNFYNHTLETKKRRLLWTVVGTIMIFIIALWIINIKTQVTDAGFNVGAEEKLWKTAKDDFKDLVTEPQKATQNKNLSTEEVKQLLQESLFSSVPTSTTSTTPTTSTLEATSIQTSSTTVSINGSSEEKE